MTTAHVTLALIESGTAAG